MSGIQALHCRNGKGGETGRSRGKKSFTEDLKRGSQVLEMIQKSKPGSAANSEVDLIECGGKLSSSFVLLP